MAPGLLPPLVTSGPVAAPASSRSLPPPTINRAMQKCCACSSFALWSWSSLCVGSTIVVPGGDTGTTEGSGLIGPILGRSGALLLFCLILICRS